MRNHLKAMLALSLVLLLLLAACGDRYPALQADEAGNVAENAPAQPAEAVEQAEEPVEQAAEEQPVEEETSAPTEEPAVPDYTPLPADPQPVSIPTADGRQLEGQYYPAKVANAPVMVLMHWAGGDMHDWDAIAPWLQNRQDELAVGKGGPLLAQPAKQDEVTVLWLDASWFPPMPAEVSFAVLVFSFGDFGNNPYGGSPDTWVDDAQAALAYAAQLDGVDPERIAALGASIGADGAVDGCYVFDASDAPGTCIGALSLSPGEYLTDAFKYADAVAALDPAGYPVWCLAAEDDYSSPEVCISPEGEHYRSFIYPGGDHGMYLVTEDSTPTTPLLDYNTLEIVQEWLETVFGLQLNEITLP